MNSNDSFAIGEAIKLLSSQEQLSLQNTFTLTPRYDLVLKRKQAGFTGEPMELEVSYETRPLIIDHVYKKHFLILLVISLHKMEC